MNNKGKNNGYNKMTQEYKEKTYVEIVSSVTMDMEKVEDGKVYLVCLSQDSDFYNGLYTAGIYGIKEYDIATNSIKENDKWIELKDLKILNEIINK